MPSLWVLTGVDGWTELAAADTTPTYAAADLRALGRRYPEVVSDEQGWLVEGARVQLTPAGSGRPIDLAALSRIPSGEVVDAVAAVGVRAIGEVRDGGSDRDVRAGLARDLGAYLDDWFRRHR
jgi:hypothetical protein